MSGLVPTLAKALRRLSPEDITALLCELTRGYEINLNLNAGEEIPAGSVVLPRKMTPEMIEAARHHSWTAVSYGWKVQKMWDEVVTASKQSGAPHG